MKSCISEMVKAFLIDNEIMTEKVRKQIMKALEINAHFTSTYALQVWKVQDIHGKDCRTSGWYIILMGTQCGVSFFINNDLEIVRKPDKRKTEVRYEYDLYNDPMFGEGFWEKYF